MFFLVLTQRGGCPSFYAIAPCFAKEIATEQCSNDKISGEIHLPASCNNLESSRLLLNL